MVFEPVLTNVSMQGAFFIIIEFKLQILILPI